MTGCLDYFESLVLRQTLKVSKKAFEAVFGTFSLWKKIRTLVVLMVLLIIPICLLQAALRYSYRHHHSLLH